MKFLQLLSQKGKQRFLLQSMLYKVEKTFFGLGRGYEIFAVASFLRRDCVHLVGKININTAKPNDEMRQKCYERF